MDDLVAGGFDDDAGNDPVTQCPGDFVFRPRQALGGNLGFLWCFFRHGVVVLLWLGHLLGGSQIADQIYHILVPEGSQQALRHHRRWDGFT